MAESMLASTTRRTLIAGEIMRGIPRNITTCAKWAAGQHRVPNDILAVSQRARACRTFASNTPRQWPELGPNESANVKTDTRRPTEGARRAKGKPLLYIGALTAALGLLAYAQPPVTARADDAKADEARKGSSKPLYSKDQVSLLCVIGYPKSGKTTQCKNLEKRWGSEGWKHVQVDSLDSLQRAIEREKEAKENGQISLIVDGYPTSLDETKEIESKICPIFCYAYFGFEEDEFVDRTGKSADEYKKLYKVQQPLREYPRKDGNVLEIVAAWPQDEVWEQVEAKVEQVIELREMGEM